MMKRLLLEKKMRQAGVYACLIIRGLQLVVEFQRKLNVSWRLGTVYLSHVGAKAHVGCVELHVVKGIDEVGPELQFEPFCELEVLMEAQVDVGIVWTADSSQLRSASTELSDRGIREVAVVREPLIATDSGERSLVDGAFAGDRREAVAIRPRAARERPGIVGRAINGLREAGVEGHDWADGPAANHGVRHFVHAAAKL